MGVGRGEIVLVGPITTALAGLSMKGLVRWRPIQPESQSAPAMHGAAPAATRNRAARRRAAGTRERRDPAGDHRRGQGLKREPEPALDLDRQIQRRVGARDEDGRGHGEGGFVELPANEGADDDRERARRAEVEQEKVRRGENPAEGRREVRHVGERKVVVEDAEPVESQSRRIAERMTFEERPGRRITPVEGVRVDEEGRAARNHECGVLERSHAPRDLLAVEVLLDERIERSRTCGG